MPLCDALDCVHLHNEGFHRGLLSLRGLLVRPTLSGRIDPRVSFCRLVSFTGKICVCFVIVTRHFPSRVLKTFSLVIVTACFAMSFTLRSAAIARLVLDASLLHCTRASPCSCILLISLSAGCGIPSSLSFLLVAMHSISADCGRLC